MTKLIEIHGGTQWGIWLTPEVSAAIAAMKGPQKLKEKAKLLSHLERFADTAPGESAFSDEQVKLEGRFRTGRGDERVQVLAFKSYQSRLYFCLDGKNRRLIVTECDLGKKQDKADRKKLESAARKFGEWTR